MEGYLLCTAVRYFAIPPPATASFCFNLDLAWLANKQFNIGWSYWRDPPYKHTGCFVARGEHVRDKYVDHLKDNRYRFGVVEPLPGNNKKRLQLSDIRVLCNATGCETVMDDSQAETAKTLSRW